MNQKTIVLPVVFSQDRPFFFISRDLLTRTSPSLAGRVSICPTRVETRDNGLKHNVQSSGGDILA